MKVQIRIPSDLLKLIEQYREDNPGIKDRSTAIRFLIQKGLETEGYIRRKNDVGV